MRFLIILVLLISPAYAGGNHHKPPEPTPINVPDDGSNHNALAIGIFVIAGVTCWVHKCWKPKPVKATGSIVPENPRNEFVYEIKP